MAALTTTITTKTVMGNKRVHYGVSTDGGTGGEIDTGLYRCEQIVLTPVHTAVKMAVLNETLPCDGAAVTIVTDGPTSVAWMAVGY